MNSLLVEVFRHLCWTNSLLRVPHQKFIPVPDRLWTTSTSPHMILTTGLVFPERGIDLHFLQCGPVAVLAEVARGFGLAADQHVLYAEALRQHRAEVCGFRGRVGDPQIEEHRVVGSRGDDVFRPLDARGVVRANLQIDGVKLVLALAGSAAELDRGADRVEGKQLGGRHGKILIFFVRLLVLGLVRGRSSRCILDVPGEQARRWSNDFP
mmetsp:Transcript_27040/g.68143  ORF Transcript_27040/g.68143 Transcript_27040/m.68143 type:complete len:210 (-) Transcript_27040:2474-3103(-)